MSHSFSNLLIHTIFSTKFRSPQLTPEIRHRLFPYMSAIVQQLHCSPLIIGGVKDHIHALIRVPPTLAICDLMRALKANSSRWIREEFRNREFEWQTGYAAFTVSQSSSKVVENYIANQEHHHKKKSFHEELMEFLAANHLAADVPSGHSAGLKTMETE